MRTLRDRMVTTLTLSLGLLAATQLMTGQADVSVVLVSGLAALALAGALGSRYLAVLVFRHLLGVGERARAHRHVLSRLPAPRHPNTPGRRRSRAPSLSVTVT